MNRTLSKIFLYFCLLVVAAFMLLPFSWMIVLSTHTTQEIIQYPAPSPCWCFSSAPWEAMPSPYICSPAGTFSSGCSSSP